MRFGVPSSFIVAGGRAMRSKKSGQTKGWGEKSLLLLLAYRCVVPTMLPRVRVRVRACACVRVCARVCELSCFSRGKNVYPLSSSQRKKEGQGEGTERRVRATSAFAQKKRSIDR